MVHVAEPGFYDAVARRVASCTAVVLEGVPGHRVRYITLVYCLLGRFRRLGLCEQSYQQLLSLFTGKIIHGDVSAEAFAASWSHLPFKVRAFVLCAIPFVAISSFLVGSREFLARDLEVTDLPDREEILESEEEAALETMLLDNRDQHLIQVLTAYCTANRNKSELVAVLYGAAHMPPIWRQLYSLGYRVHSSSWEMVFSFETV
jgi:hypothetical protein